MPTVRETLEVARDHCGAGEFQKAEQLVQQILQSSPATPEAWSALGEIYQSQSRLAEAATNYRQAVALKPEFAKAHHNLGVALAEQGQLDEAVASLRQAVHLKPDNVEALFNLGQTLADLGRPEEAVAYLRRVLDQQPDHADALNTLGLLLTELGQSGEGLILLQQAARLRPHHLGTRNNLGMALSNLGRFAEARTCLERALRENPNDTKALTNLGCVYRDLGRLEEAVAYYNHALRLQPDAASTHFHRALAWLQMGDYERGWPEYEWRWRRRGAQPRPFTQPTWDGSPLEGRPILVHGEQGLGDMIQFIRYAVLAKERGGRVIVECPSILVPLFATAPGIDQLVALGTERPPFDVHASLLSLPALLKTTLGTTPAQIPYLAADPERLDRWRQCLDQPAFKIGIGWQGDPHQKWDRYRSFPVAQLAPLAELPGVQLFSLQKGPGVEQLQDHSCHFSVTMLAEDLDAGSAAFLDTAAIMKSLDLVVTADTSLAHLAGALAVPVWVALSALSDWRWIRNRDDSPWYPTLRLFRQRVLGEWEPVFDRMAAELQKLLARRGRGGLVSVPMTPGELLDKMSILKIKSARLQDSARLRHVHAELTLLMEIRDRELAESPDAARLEAELRSVNETLWDVEDAIRLCEREQDFGPRFLELARSVYRHNDRRAALKRQLNELLGSPFQEQKSYTSY